MQKPPDLSIGFYKLGTRRGGYSPSAEPDQFQL